uniref:B12-binding domain-containing protein n=1 Tax=Candidatus Methanomethylicus mesodigestus TaxID=1867258 RepID=A0A7C3EVM8_9CREN
MADPGPSLSQLSAAILAGNSQAAISAIRGALSAGTSPDDLIFKGILGAWSSFCAWHERDPQGALKAWLDCFNATMKALKEIDASTQTPRKEAPSVIVATARGEGHILMKEIITTMLRSRGFRVHSSRKGVTMDDLKEALSDPALKFAILSCIDPEALDSAIVLVRGIRAARGDVKIIAGGPMAQKVGADVIINEIDQLLMRLIHY